MKILYLLIGLFLLTSFVNAVPHKFGPIDVNGQADFSNIPIINVGTPVNDTDAATKAYADSSGGGSNPYDANINCNATKVWVEARNGTVLYSGTKGANDDDALIYALDEYKGQQVGVISNYVIYYIDKNIEINGTAFYGGTAQFSDTRTDNNLTNATFIIVGNFKEVKNLVCFGQGDGSTGRGIWVTANNIEGGTVTGPIDGSQFYASGYTQGIALGPDEPSDDSFCDSMFTEIRAVSCGTGIITQGNQTQQITLIRPTAVGCDVGIWYRGGIISQIGGGVSICDEDYRFGPPLSTDWNALESVDFFSLASEVGQSDEIFINTTQSSYNGYVQPVRVTFYGGRQGFFSNTDQRIIRWNCTGDLTFRDCNLNANSYHRIYMAPNETAGVSRVIIENGKDSSAVDWNEVIQVEPANNATKYSINGLRFNGPASGTIERWKLGDLRSVDDEKEDKISDFIVGLGGCSGVWSPKYGATGFMRNAMSGKAWMTTPYINPAYNLLFADYGLYGYGGADDGSYYEVTGPAVNFTSGFTLGFIGAKYAPLGEHRPIQLHGVNCFSFYANNADTGVIGFALSDTYGAEAYMECLANQSDDIHTAHLIVGRYTSGSKEEIDTINLKTGEKVNNEDTSGIKTYDNIGGTNSLQVIPRNCLTGIVFFFPRTLTDAEVERLQDYVYAVTSR